MHKMEMFEVHELFNVLEYTDVNLWETTRALAYITAQVNSTKKLNPEDVIKLPWDSKQKEDKKPLTQEDIKRMEALSQKILKSLK